MRSSEPDQETNRRLSQLERDYRRLHRRLTLAVALLLAALISPLLHSWWTDAVSARAGQTSETVAAPTVHQSTSTRFQL